MTLFLERELQKEVTVIEQRILASKSEIPPSSVLRQTSVGKNDCRQASKTNGGKGR